MPFMYNEPNLINGYPVRCAPSVSGIGTTAALFNWYDSASTKWIMSATIGFPIMAGTTQLLTKWYKKNSQYFYANTANTLFLWWSSDLSLWVVSSKLGGGTAETWVYTDPEDEDAGGAYEGDDWWSFSAYVGTFLPRGAKRGTTLGAYDSANNLTVALSNADRFELAGTNNQGTYTGYGTYDGKSLYVGRKQISLAEGDNTFSFLESWPESGYAYLSNQTAYPAYVQTTEGDLLLDKSYTAAFGSIAAAPVTPLTFKQTTRAYISNEIILT